MTPTCPDDFAIGNLWPKFKLHELKTIMRQKNTDFAELCVRVRTNSVTDDDIKTLVSRDIDAMPYDNPKYPSDTHHVFPQNSDVDAFNMYKLDQLEGTEYTINADDATLLETTKAPTSTTEKLVTVGGLRNSLKLKLNARVTLTSNIDNPDGLCNGASGVVTGIEMKDDIVVTVYVKFDNERVGRKAISANKTTCVGSVPIRRCTFQNSKGQTRTKVQRTQFPLTLSWASTIHKVQGKTMSSIVIVMTRFSNDHTGKIHRTNLKYRQGMFYVALSRVTSIDGLTLVGFRKEEIRVSFICNSYVHATLNLHESYSITVIFRLQYMSILTLYPY